MKIEEFDFSALSPEAKQWLASAIAGMICADGQVDDKELGFLREVIQFLDTAEEINKMINLVKKREKPVLRVLKVDHRKSYDMMKLLTSLSAQDDRLARSEAKFLKYAGAKLGYEPSFINSMMKWALKEIEVSRMEHELWETAKVLVPNYTDLINF